MLQANAEERKDGLNGTAAPPVGQDFSRIPRPPPPETTNAVIQRKPGDVDESSNQSPLKEGRSKGGAGISQHNRFDADQIRDLVQQARLRRVLPFSDSSGPYGIQVGKPRPNM